MFIVIFEVQPHQEHFDRYLAIAKTLRPELEQIDGFLVNERFRHAQIEGRLLSLSTWRDEKALIRWRTHARHHLAQRKGRDLIFQNYALRVGEIVADTTVDDAELPQLRLDETESAEAKAVTIVEQTGTQPVPMPDLVPKGDTTGLLDQRTFHSLYGTDKSVILGYWRSGDAALRWQQALHAAQPDLPARTVRITRTYGMFERQEAPQYFPTVEARTSPSSR